MFSSWDAGGASLFAAAANELAPRQGSSPPACPGVSSSGRLVVLRRRMESRLTLTRLPEYVGPFGDPESACGDELPQDTLARRQIDVEQSGCLSDCQIQSRHLRVLGGDPALKFPIARLARRALLQNG
jgi:hypothetical protein